MFDFKMSGLCNKETRGLLKLNISDFLLLNAHDDKKHLSDKGVFHLIINYLLLMVSKLY
jgi:hypothetical protein